MCCCGYSVSLKELKHEHFLGTDDHPPNFISSGDVGYHMLGNERPLVYRAHGQINHLAAIWLECKELITFTLFFCKSVLLSPSLQDIMQGKGEHLQTVHQLGRPHLPGVGITEWGTVECAGEGHNDCRILWSPTLGCLVF